MRNTKRKSLLCLSAAHTEHYLCDWTVLDTCTRDQQHESLTTLAQLSKRDFMKANPDNRWRKMPPGSAESLPPSNAKPYTPSPALPNGVTCNNLLSASSLSSVKTMSDQPSAPKPFKKRYLASNQASSPVSPGQETPPSPRVSPDAATACEALMELSRTDSRASRTSDGSSTSSDRRGSPSESQPLQTLREAVWSKVATTLLKQEEEKLVEPPKDSPMNLSDKNLTIRTEQIIGHVIENILDKPMEEIGSTCEPINVSVNNNQEDGIKASIYESLKIDLLTGKTPKISNSKSNPPTPPGVNTKAATSPSSKASSVSMVVNQPARIPKTIDKTAVTNVSPSSSSTSTASLSHSPPGPGHHQDVLRLLARSSQHPVNVGNSSITITKTPRVSQSLQTPGLASSGSSTPVSVSLTRTGSNQVFNLSAGAGGLPVVLNSQPGVMLSTHPPQASVLLHGQPSDCVLLSPAISGAATGQVVLAPGVGGQPLLIAPGSKLILAPSVHSNHRPVQTSSNSVTLNNKSQSNPTSAATCDNSDPVNLTVSKSLRSQVAENHSIPPSVCPQTATLKRPASFSDGEDDDIRRSSRSSKGRRYQEFIEDGRINLGTRSKRRSYRSGEETNDGDMEPLSLCHQATNQPQTSFPNEELSSNINQINHWKKKLRTVSLGEVNTQSSPSISSTATTTAKSAHNDAKRQEPPHRQRTTRQSADLKLGDKKIRADKISL